MSSSYFPFVCFIFFFFFICKGSCQDGDLKFNSALIKVYKDGRVVRFVNLGQVPAGLDANTSVDSKDVVISTQTGVRVRLYLPQIAKSSDKKLPVLVFYHGGGFYSGSIATPDYHNFLNYFVAQTNVIVASVDYRVAPEHTCPTQYDDSWEALKWVASHSDQNGPEPWLKDHADFQRVFISGDSSGGNVAYNVAMRAGGEPLGSNAKLVGTILLHPFFWGSQPLPSESSMDPRLQAFFGNTWTQLYCPSSSAGVDDPRLNAIKDPKTSTIGGTKVLVCVAEQDPLRDRARAYYEKLGKSGWQGVVELMETAGEGHVFFLKALTSPNTAALLKRVSAFMN